MSPIRPENRARYPKDWKAIRAGILVRAKNRCECRGECGTQHNTKRDVWRGSRGTTYYKQRCAVPDGLLIDRGPKPGEWHEHDCWDHEGGPCNAKRVVLTIAHLDHTPENNAPSNLRAFCQLCHNRYDTKHRQANAATTRHRKRGSLDLFAQEGR